MNDTEHAALLKQVLGRDVDPNTYTPTMDEFRAIRLAEIDYESDRRTAAAEAALAENERQRLLAEDPLYERKAEAQRLREEAAAEEAKYQDALTLVQNEHGHELPDQDASGLDRADLYRLAYGEGRDTFNDLAEDVNANAARALSPRGQTEQEKTNEIYRQRWAKEDAAYKSHHPTTPEDN